MTFPTRETIATTAGRATGTTSYTANLPSGITSGDLLILIVGCRANSVNTISGWTSFADSGASLTDQRSFWRKADGTEGTTVDGTFASNNAEWSSVAYRFSGTADPDTTPPEGATAYADTDQTTADPPILTPTGGAKDYYWIATYFHRDGGTSSAYPSGYSNTGDINSSGSGHSNNTGYCDKTANASSENPGTFTKPSADWSATTIAIHPAAAAAGGPNFMTLLGVG